MITKEQLNKICEYRSRDRVITTEVLYNFGLTNEDIKKLLDENILKRVEFGDYELISADILYQYSESIRDEERYYSYHCNEIVHELDPHHKENNLRLLAFYVKKERYSEAFDILDDLYQNRDIEKYNDLYLYILSAMTLIPERYHERIKTITDEYLLDAYDSSYEEQTMVYKITKGKYISAIHTLNNIKQKHFSTCEETVWQIISKIAEVDKENYQTLLKYAKEERYHDIQKILTSKTTLNKKTDKCILEVVNDIIMMIKSNTLPVKTREDADNLYDAICANDYELACKFNIEYLEKYNLNKSNALSVLLEKISELINRTKKESSIEESEEKTSGLSNLIEELSNNNIEEFTKLLKKYLEDKKLSEHGFLIVNLMKIDILNMDYSYPNTINILKELETSIINLNISNYIDKFYYCISNKKIEIAKIYFEIISRYSHETISIIEKLRKSLEIELVNPKISQEENLSLDKNETNLSDKELGELKESILRKISEAKSKEQAIVIFENVSVDVKKVIYSIFENNPDYDLFSIGEEPQLITIRILNRNQEHIIRTEYFQDIFTNNQIRKYEEVIRLGNILFQDKNYNPFSAPDPRPILDIIGHAYYKLNKIEEAIAYLTIVTEINRRMQDRKDNRDYTHLINLLKTKIENSKKKESTPHEEKEIKELEEIAYFIKETNISLDDTKQKYNLSEEDTIMIRLIYIRDYYIEEMYSIGDSKLKEIEKIKNKTPRIITFIKELKTNKKFYKNRLENHTKKRNK